MQFRFEARATPSRRVFWLSPLVALALSCVVAMAIFALSGLAPVASLITFITEPVSSMYGLGELLIKAAPLILIAVGLAIGFRANVWNIGAEGQIIMGVIFSGGLALTYGDSGSWLVLPGMVLLGLLGGCVWASIPALLRIHFRANEILTSLMLNYVAHFVLIFLVHGIWRDPAGFNFPQSKPLGDAALFPVLIEGTRANASILFAPLAVVLAWLLLKRSFLGFQLQARGVSQNAAQYAGFRADRAILVGMLCGGAAAGVAGVAEVAGPLGQIYPSVTPGYGYAAIIVAFLGRLHPVGILFAGLLMALLYLSGDAAQMILGLPPSIAGVIQATLLFFLLSTEVLVNYRLRRSSEVTSGSTVA